MPAITITVDSAPVCVYAPGGLPKLSIQETLNGRATAQFQIQDIDHADWLAKLPGAWLFKEVSIDHGADRVFAGVVTRQTNSGEKGLSQHAYIDVRAVDFAWYLDARIIFFSWEPDTTVQDIVQGCIEYSGPSGDSLSGLGFTYANTSAVPTIPRRYIADGKTIAQVFDDIAALVGYQWYVDWAKDVNFIAPGSAAAPYDLDEAVGVCDYEYATTQRTTENYRNTQWVRQSLAALAPLTEVFVGDGTTRTFFTPFALADNAPRVFVRDATYAQTTISFAGTAAAADTVTIDGEVYTFVATLAAPNDVLIGQNATESTRNLAYAINNTAGWAGVYFDSGTTTHPTCEAAYNGGQVITIRVREVGTGDGTAISKSSADITLGAATLTGAATGTVTEQTLGIFGVDPMGSADWYWAPGSTAIYQDEAPAALAVGQYLEVQYLRLFSNSIYASDEAEVTANTRVEAIVDADQSSTGGDMFRSAEALLRRYGTAEATLISYGNNSYKQALVSQLRVGMTHVIDFTNTHGFTGDMLVTDINRSFFGRSDGAGLIEWETRNTISGIAFPSSDGERWERWADFFLPDSSTMSGGSAIVGSGGAGTTYFSVRFVLLTGSVGTNKIKTSYRVGRSGKSVRFRRAVINHDVAPATNDVIVDITHSDDQGSTRNSIFPAGDPNKIVLPVGDFEAIITPTWAIETADEGNWLNVDVIQADPAVTGMNVLLEGDWQ
jgi:hypothetical protein